MRSQLIATDCFRQGHSLRMVPQYSKPASCCCCRSRGQTDGWTVTWLLHRPCTTYDECSINKPRTNEFLQQNQTKFMLCSFIMFYPLMILFPNRCLPMSCPWEQSVLYWRWTCDSRLPVYYTTHPLLSTASTMCLQFLCHRSSWSRDLVDPGSCGHEPGSPYHWNIALLLSHATDVMHKNSNCSSATSNTVRPATAFKAHLLRL